MPGLNLCLVFKVSQMGFFSLFLFGPLPLGLLLVYLLSLPDRGFPLGRCFLFTLYLLHIAFNLVQIVQQLGYVVGSP